MNKTWLIIKREYITRVRKRSFLIITFLVPFLLFGFSLLEIYLVSGGSKKNQEIAVIDDSGSFQGKLKDGENIHFHFIGEIPPQEYKMEYSGKGYSGLLYIPKFDLNLPVGFTYFGPSQLGIESHNYIRDQINKGIENERMEKAGIDLAELGSIKSDISLMEKTGDHEKSSSYIVASVVAGVCGFLIYFILIFFGMSVMRGVMEEKTNRIAEVVISSVRPFQLMLGKIIGIAGVGFTQFLIWLILIFSLFVGLGSFAPRIAQNAQRVSQVSEFPQVTKSQNQALTQFSVKMDAIANSNVNFPLVIFCFFFYFLGGYLLYASLFAAVGSVVDQDSSDAQSLTFPITLPIIISFFIMFGTIQQPNSSLAVDASIFPLSSPLVMMARIPFGVPWWEILISMGLLILTFLFTTWIAGKIYRTGILLYGKKVTFREMGKWLFRKG